MATDSSALINFLKNNAPDKFTMIDIGAKKGKWLVPYVENFPETNFYCFEALPEEFEVLKNRYKNFSNISSFNFVLSDVTGQIKFYRDKVRPSWSGIKKHQYMDQFDEIILESATLDSFNIKPFLIKIDVEGAELLVFKGSQNTLIETKVIFFECNEVHFKNYNYTAEDLFDYLNDVEFKIYNLNLEELSKDEFTYLTADDRRYENPKGYQGNFFAIKGIRTLENLQ
jgi:FkbM family methyltransferase